MTIISVDEVTIVELRNITASTISRQQFFYDELTITATRNITESTITAKKKTIEKQRRATTITKLKRTRKKF